jgi:hypothetical protein
VAAVLVVIQAEETQPLELQTLAEAAVVLVAVAVAQTLQAADQEL